MLDTPHRIQLRRIKGWRMPEGTVRVARPSLWGNPFIHPDPTEAVAAYRKHLQGGTQVFEIKPGGLQFAPGCHPRCLHYAWPEWARGNLPSLRGKNLACWCPLDQPCHADVLLEMANAPLRCDAP
jgi:hypothetical protein